MTTPPQPSDKLPDDDSAVPSHTNKLSDVARVTTDSTLYRSYDSRRQDRRSFTNEYKLRILAELDMKNYHGAVTEVTRREGLSEASIYQWRKARNNGQLGNPVTTSYLPGSLAAESRKLTGLLQEKARLSARKKTILAKISDLESEIESLREEQTEIAEAQSEVKDALLAAIAEDDEE